VFVVLHIAATGSSVLASILDRVSPMRCEPARDGLAMQAGHLYVAPPDCHLLVQDSRMRLDDGPRVNGHRPAVDPLLRSAAEVFGSRCCGVVLSGTRDDGTAGLAAVKARGGTTVVQDPADALYSGMPENAIAHVNIDAVLPTASMAPALVQLVRDGTFPSGTPAHDPAPMRDPSSPALFVCPECGGRAETLRRLPDDSDEAQEGVA
jgi:two-component system chemotaxis response regulator CheB